MPMLALIAAVSAAAQPAPATCLNPKPGQVVMQLGTVQLSREEGAEPLQVAAVATKDALFAQTFGVAQTDIYVWGAECEPIYNRTFGGATMLRFDRVRMGADLFLHVVARYPGGSGEGRRHELLEYDDVYGDLHAVAPMPLFHSNMGASSPANLAGGRGQGIALWDADWGEDESHYSPHRATLYIYKWADGRFTGPETLKTDRQVAAEPHAAPAALGLSFRDLTGTDRDFISSDALIAAPMANTEAVED